MSNYYSDEHGDSDSSMSCEEAGATVSEVNPPVSSSSYLQHEINTHKNDIAVLKNDMSELKFENKTLKQQLKKISKSSELNAASSEEDQLKTQNEDLKNRLTKVSKFEDKEKALKKENEELKQKLEDSTRKLSAMDTILQDQNKLKKENKELKSKNKKLLKQIQENEKSTNTDFCEEKLKEKNHEIENFIIKSKKDTDLLSSQLEEIKQLRNSTREAEDKYTSLHENYVEVSRQLNTLQQTITALEAEQEKKNQSIETLRNMIQNQSEISDDDEDKTDLKNALKENIASLKKEKTALQNDLTYAQHIIKVMTNEQDRNKQEIEALRKLAKNEPESEDLSILNEQITVLNNTLKEHQQLAIYLKKENTDLRQDFTLAQQALNAMTAEQERKNDEFLALQQQLEIYKNDFAAEQESKFDLKRETRNMKQLREKNKELENDLEFLRARRQPRDEGYACPKCSFNFKSIENLEKHVNKCLDMEGDEFP